MLNNTKVLFATSVLLFVLSFSGHVLSTLSIEKFLDAEFPSERYAFSRLVYNLQHGVDEKGGFMLRYEDVDMLYKSIDRDDYAEFKATIEEAEDPKISVYFSHAAIQDDIVFPIWKGLEWVRNKVLENAREGSRWHKRLNNLDWYYYYMISQSIVMLVNAIALSLFVLWVAKTFHPVNGWFVLGMLVVFAPVLTFFGKSIWWMMWSWFLPFLITIYALHFTKGQPPKMWFTALIAVLLMGALFIKTAMGYEFVSTIMVAAMVPVIFYAFYKGWTFKQWFAVSAAWGLGCLMGVVFAVAYHWHLLAAYGMDPQKYIQSRYEMRAHGGNEAINNAAIKDSTEQSVLGIIFNYFTTTRDLAVPQILLMFPFLLWFKNNRKNLNDIDRAFVISIGISVLGALSMLVILKGHAYIHGFDIVIWMIPLNLMLFAFYSLKLSERYIKH